jgi:hypothetical protein
MITPIPVTKEQLLSIIDDIRTRVAKGDSWEGNLNWMMPKPEHDPDIVAVVEARYRIGNSDGSQGGMRVIGDVS